MNSSLDQFKKVVFKIAALTQIKRMTIGSSDGPQLDIEQVVGKGINQNLLAMRIAYVGGILPSDQVPAFRRLIIRSTRCQVLVKTFELNLEPSDQLVGDTYDQKKSVFVLAYQEGTSLDDKIKRITGGYATEVFEVQLETLNSELSKAF